MSSPIEFIVDMSAMDELIGTVFALDSIGRQSRYMQDSIHCGFNFADKDFNREVVAFAKATGSISHMFEWGTVGINTSKSNMAPDPMSEQARLWEPVFVSGRKISRLDFTYKPSVANVPKPPADKTGIPQKTLNKLKWHVFEWKARVLEEGIPVTIKAKPGNETGMLFVPNIWKGEKGYTMYKRPTTPDISKNTQGTFTSFWVDYWNTRGRELIQSEVIEYFKIDLETAARAIRGRRGMHSPSMTIDNQIIEMTARAVRANFERAAMTRLAGSEA